MTEDPEGFRLAALRSFEPRLKAVFVLIYGFALVGCSLLGGEARGPLFGYSLHLLAEHPAEGGVVRQFGVIVEPCRHVVTNIEGRVAASSSEDAEDISDGVVRMAQLGLPAAASLVEEVARRR